MTDIIEGRTTLGDDKDRKSRPQPRQTKAPANDRDMGSALRSIYQRAVEEKIPDEMLDLLGKLG